MWKYLPTMLHSGRVETAELLAASDFRHTAAGARKYREQTIKPTTIR